MVYSMRTAGYGDTAVVTRDPSARRTLIEFPTKLTIEGFFPNSDASRSITVRGRRLRSTKMTEGKRNVVKRDSWMAAKMLQSVFHFRDWTMPPILPA